MKLTEKQAEVARDIHRFRVLNFGRKSGKTDLAIEEIIGFAAIRRYTHSKRPKISYIGETRKEAKRIAWDRAKIRITPLFAKEANESNLELYIKNNKLSLADGNYSTVYFDGWENISALVGEEFDFLVMDEVSKYRNFWVGWQEILRPTLGPRKGQAMFISRPQGFNHWYDLTLLELKNENYKTFHATSYDNPHIDPKEIEEARKELSPERFSQEYMAEFVKQEGLIYKDFKRTHHVVKTEPDVGMVVEFIAGLDWGFEHPSVVLHCKVDRMGNVWVLDEWVKRHKTECEVVNYVASCNFNAVYPDPENKSGVESLSRAGVSVREVHKGSGSVAAGIDRVRHYLRENKIKVHERCLNTISEFETYSYQPEKEEPQEENDDCLDALRYVISALQYNPTHTVIDLSWRMDMAARNIKLNSAR